MPAGYSSQPVSGFTGHMPGAKWQVGRRYVPPAVDQRDLVNPQTSSHQLNLSDSRGIQPPFHQSTPEVHFANQEHALVDEGTQSEMSFRQDIVDRGVSYVNGMANDVLGGQRHQAPYLSPGSSNYSMGFDAQGRPVRISQQQNTQFAPHSGQMGQYHTNGMHQYSQGYQGYADSQQRAPQQGYDSDGRQIQVYQNNITEFPSQTGHMSRSDMSMTAATGRSRSLPRRRVVEKDPFEGVESGWWSKGEVLRNKERREMAEKGKSIMGGDWNAPKVDVSPPRRTWKERGDEMEDIPAAGYSGHIQGLRQLQVGKPYHRAAKEAKEQFVERRRARSGGREQFYSNGSAHLDGGSEQLNYAHSVHSGMHARSGF